MIALSLPKVCKVSALLVAAMAMAPASAQSLKVDEVYSSLDVSTISSPNPVLGADNRIHLAYELSVVNPTRLFLTIDKFEAVDRTGRVLGSLTGSALASMVVSQGNGTRLAPGASAYLFLDVSLASGSALPVQLAPRITLSRQMADAAGKPIAFPADQPLPATVSFTGPAVKVGTSPAVVVAPPLRGTGWLAVNGCCDSVTSHRGAVMAINGQLRVPERFAIDWLQLDSKGHLYTGNVAALNSYAFFGASIHAVATGTVVNLYDQAKEQVPGSPAKGITPENIGGNMLVIDIGGGHYAFYAHLQPGSLKVKVGDRVKAGDVIALLGNTGNSDAPHLHFHVMDGPSPLNSNGLPFVFTRFTGAGVMDPASLETVLDKGGAAVIDRTALAGPHRNQLPLNNQVVNFEPELQPQKTK